MAKLTEYNKGSLFSVNFDNREFVSLETLYQSNPDAIYRLSGLYINTKSKYGPRPYAAAELVRDDGSIFDAFLADLPMHMLGTVEEIIKDHEAIADINSGRYGFFVRQYFSKNFNKDCYSITFCELR